jgi:hypothetical protein
MALIIFVDLTPGLPGSILEHLHLAKADGIGHARLNAHRLLPEYHSIVAQVVLVG